MLAVQYGITFALAKGLAANLLHAHSAAAPFAAPFIGFASGSIYAIVGLALTVIGLVIVYNGTLDFGLTLGYFIVRWIEGYLLSFVLTAAVLASLGLHPNATQPVTSPAITSPALTSPSGTAETPNTGSSAEVSVANASGIYLKVTGRVLSVILPPELRVDGQLVNTQDSTVYLNCIPANGPGFSLAPHIQLFLAPVAWRLSPSQTPLTTCDGTVTLSHGTRLTKLNQGTNLTGFKLLPWKLSPH
jgi:hypothetical protein